MCVCVVESAREEIKQGEGVWVPQAEVGCMCWKDFCERMTLEQEPNRSEGLRMSLGGKTGLNKGHSSRLREADKLVRLVSSGNTRSPM